MKADPKLSQHVISITDLRRDCSFCKPLYHCFYEQKHNK